MANHSPGLEDTDFRSYPDIGDYAVIGDCRSAALVSKYGWIDWLCWPRFDSPSIFAALLDRERGGFWKISPVETFSVEREYLDGSNVLQTKFQTSGGIVALTDLMPVRDSTKSVMVPDHEISAGSAASTERWKSKSSWCPAPTMERQLPLFEIAASLGSA